MHNFRSMEIGNSRYNLIKNLASLRLFKRFDLFNGIVKLSTLTKLRNNIKLIIILKKLVHFNNIRMILNEEIITHYLRMSN